MRWLGVSQRAFDMLCERARHRHAFGSVLADKQTVQNWVADSAAQMQAARLMTLHAAWKMDTEGAAAARTGDRADQVLRRQRAARRRRPRAADPWRAGYSTDLPLEAMYRYARAARLYDGADEVHRQSRRPPDPARLRAARHGVPSEHVPTRREAARERFADLLEAVTSND